MALLQTNDGIYLGCPWRIDGKTMGVCCCFIKAKPEFQLTQEEMVRKLNLDKLALRVEEAIIEAAKSPVHRRKMNAEAQLEKEAPFLEGPAGKMNDVRFGQIVPVAS